MGRIVDREELCEGARERVWREQVALEFLTWPSSELATAAKFSLRSWGNLPQIAAAEIERRRDALGEE